MALRGRRVSRQMQLQLVIVALLWQKSQGKKFCLVSNRWGIIRRGGSTEATTNALDESLLLESFQEEVSQMRRELEQETADAFEELRNEILQARNAGKFDAKTGSADAIPVQTADEESPEAGELEKENFPEYEALSTALEEHVEEKERVQLFEETDDFLVGDSDEEPDSVLGRMPTTKRIKVDDLVPQDTEEEDIVIDNEQEEEDLAIDNEQEEEDMISHLAHADADETVETVIEDSALAPLAKKKAKKKNKRKKKKKKKVARLPDSSSTTKTKRARKPKTRLATTLGKETVNTALSSQLDGDQVVILNRSPLVESLVKGIVLAVLAGLTILVLRILEKSVTS